MQRSLGRATRVCRSSPSTDGRSMLTSSSPGSASNREPTLPKRDLWSTTACSSDGAGRGRGAGGRVRRRRRGAVSRDAARRAPASRAEPRDDTRPLRRREHGRSRRPTTTCHSSTPISSISATRPSGTWTRGWTPSSSGQSRKARESSATSRTTSPAGSCSGTCGTRCTARELIAAGRPVQRAGCAMDDPGARSRPASAGRPRRAHGV